MLALRLPPEIEKRLEVLAKKTGRTKSYYAREALLRHIEHLEARYLARRKVGGRDKRVAPERLEVTEMDDPFATFSEWAGEEDEKAYAGL